jgi:predicted acyltransferase
VTELAAAPKAARIHASADRNPELDMARGAAIVAAALVLFAPDPTVLPTWLGASSWHGASIADLLPASFACLAGVAIAHQARARSDRSWAWWLGRMARRLLVLVGLGVLLVWLTSAPSLPVDPGTLRWTDDLVRIGVATVIAIPLVRLPRWGAVGIATLLLVGHSALTLSAGPELTPASNGLIGLDQRLLGLGHALVPVDPNGVTALAPTLVALLIGFWIGEWIDDRPRGAATGSVLLLLGAWAGVVAWSWNQVMPANATLWTGPIIAGGVAMTLLLLSLGHLGTRWSWTDRAVATLASLGRGALPSWIALVLLGAVVAPTTPLRWFVADGLGSLITPFGASLVVSLVVVYGLLRLSDLLQSRNLNLRA